MPIIKSAAKRVRQTIKRKARNQAVKRDLRSATKELGTAVTAKDTKKAAELLPVVQSHIDTAVKKGILKKNTAARRLAQLSAQVKSIGAKPAATTAKKTATKAAAKPATKKTPAKTATKPAAKKAPAKATTTKAPAKKVAPKKPVAKK